MFLREFFKKSAPIINEGGNALINGEMADRIDSNARAEVIPILTVALNDINNSFKSFSGKDLWSPKLLASRKFLSGSSFHFFDRENISDLEFHEAKPTVGDIDTQVDKDLRETIIEWLKSIPLKSKIGDAVYVGLKGTEPGEEKHLAGGQLITLWNFPNIEIEMEGANGIKTRRGTNIQIDLELKTFETPAGQDYAQPTRWSLFSASSAWEDLKLGIKGVFHKYLIQSMTTLTSKEVIVRKPKYNRKTKSYDSFEYSEAKYRNLFTFAVSSKEGGGLRTTYEPIMLDKDTQETMNGLPLYQEKGTTGYEQDVDQIFANIFGDRVSIEDVRKYGTKLDSFVGLLDILNTVCNDDEKIKIRDRFISKCLGFEEGRAQELDAINPGKDRNDKLAAINLLVLKLKVQLPDNFDTIVDTYYQNYKIRQPTNEQTEPASSKPNYARQGIQHIYNRLPDGRVSSMEMKDLDFIELCKEIAENGGTLDNVPVNLKIDGAGIRFGKDENGRPFMMTSKVTTPIYADNATFFTDFERKQGRGEEFMRRAQNYDDAVALITQSNFIQSLPDDTIVQAEMLYNPMAQNVDGQLKFVNIPYDPKKLGRQMTLVPFMVKQFSTGETRPDQDKVIKKLIAGSDKNVKIITNNLEQKGINVSKIIDPVVNLDPNLLSALQTKGKNNPAKDQAKEILDKARQELSAAIIDSPKLKGKDMLGSNMEGIVINMPSGRLVKVTSQQMKSAMAAKTSTQSFGDTNTRTAVVAIGNFAGHKGHEELIDLAVKKADEVSGKPFVFIGHKVGPDDPIDIKTKIETLEKLFPGVEISVVQNQIGSDGEETVGNIFKKIEYELIKKEPFYNNIIITVGSDQAGVGKTAAAMQSRYSKFPPLAHVKVSAYVTPRGTGVSTTQLRNALKNMPEEQAFQVWSKAYNVEKLGADWIKHLMSIARKNMGLPDQSPQNKLPDTPVQEKMAPRSHFAGKWKLGPAAHLKGNMKRPARQGDLVGGAESIDHKQIPIGENYEKQMSKLIKLLEKKYGH